LVAALDDTVKNVTEALKEKGFMDNAILVFTTDVSKISKMIGFWLSMRYK